MPTYCYRSGRHVIERVYSVRERPETVEFKGRVYRRDRAAEMSGIGFPASRGWPFECAASGVAPSQADELRRFYVERGVPTEVTEDGNPVYRSPAHRRKALKARGMHDNDSYC